jgi:THO complex subunit 5
LAVTDTNIVQEPIDVNMDGRLESAREDGELPSLIAAASAVNDVKLPPKVSTLEHSRQLSLMSKSIISPISKVKSQSFKKHDEDFDLLLDTDSDLDELSQIEPEVETDASIKYNEMAEKSWVDYGVKEYTLVLIRKKDDGEKKVKLEAKVSLNYSLVLVLH